MVRCAQLLAGIAVALVATYSQSRKTGKGMAHFLRESRKDEVSSGDGGPKFALRLLASLARGDRENVFVSPLSLGMALGMAEAGATEGSAHAAALGRLASSRRAPDGLVVANSVWTRSAILSSYKALVAERFGAESEAMPSSAAPINAWVSEKTRGLVGDLVDDDVVRNPLTKAILLNAVYFKGTWAARFDADRSAPGPFAAPRGPKDVVMMRQLGRFPVAHARGVGTAVALPYVQGGLRMVFVLPEAPHLAGARALAGGLADAWDEIRPATRASGEVDVMVPKFQVDSGVVDLLPILADDFGLAVIRDADGGFLKMADAPDLHVDSVVQRAFVSVDEEGTEAAAATAAVMMTRSIPRPPRKIHFDRPFLFVIEDAETGDVAFAGLLADP